MIGTIINTVLILAGCAIGMLVRKGIPEHMKQTVIMSMGLAVALIGISGALKTSDTMCVVISMAVGSLIGSALNIEKRLEQLGQFAEKKLSRISGGDTNISKGFVTASLVFCVGAMAIVGSIESGLMGKHDTLITKGVIDGVSAIIFTSTMGIGVALSAAAVFVYQGVISLLSGWLGTLLTDAMINEMSAVGSLLILGVSLNLIYDKHIPVGNMLPAIFVPILYLPLMSLFA